MTKDLNGHVIVVMAPTGSGKGTLMNYALEVIPDIYTSVSCTTRAMRPKEVEGKDYYFITKEEFSKKIQNGEFLEWAEYGLNRYGTLKNEILPTLEAGQVILVEMEIQGVKQLHKIIPKENMTVVYIEAGGWEVLKSRALDRAPIDKIELQKRYERYLAEIDFKQFADVVIDNSGKDFAPAKEKFVSLIKGIYSKIEKK